MKNRGRLGRIFFLVLMFVVVPVYAIGDFYLREKCEVKTTGFLEFDAIEKNSGEKETSHIEDDGKTYKELVEDGQFGEKKVCRRGYTTTSEAVIKEYRRPVYNVYTYKYVAPKPATTPPPSEGKYYTGVYDEPTAICADGTYSYSTGRGTCSRHGGVDEWL